MIQIQNLERKERRNPADTANFALLESKRVRCTTHVVCLSVLAILSQWKREGETFLSSQQGTMCILSGSQCVQYRDISRTCQARSGVSWIAGNAHYCQDMRGKKDEIINEKQ